MKKRINLTIDSDLYEDLDNLPRKVSVSEITNLLLKAFIQEVKKGGELSTEELHALADSIGDGTLRERLKDQWGPGFKKIENVVESVKEKVGLGKNKKEE
jgi:hypothetical protein